jgi:hypothetical protein
MNATLRELGGTIKIYDSWHRLKHGYILIEAKENIEIGNILTWGKALKAKRCEKKKKIMGVAIRNMKKGERDIVKFYGPIDIKVGDKL